MAAAVADVAEAEGELSGGELFDSGQGRGRRFGTTRGELLERFFTAFRFAGGVGAAVLSESDGVGVDAVVEEKIRFSVFSGGDD